MEFLSTLYSKKRVPLSLWRCMLLGCVAVVSFHIACFDSRFAPAMVLFIACLLALAEAATHRIAFYTALLAGIACYAPHLAFFWSIFGPVAISLWTIVAIWLGFIVLLVRLGRAMMPPVMMLMLAPLLWTGFEYFRSELYYLRFSWLTPGIAFGPSPFVRWVGVYGVSFLMAAAAAVLVQVPRRWLLAAAAGVLGVLALPGLLARPPAAAAPTPPGSPQIVGIQLENAGEDQLLDALDAAVSNVPDVDLLLLSEYTLSSPPTPAIKAWCRSHRRYLILGGTNPVPNRPGAFANMAFVIDPKGEICFSQGKSVPIQFFSDGLPAREQRVWESPWGKIGICICYDLSYSRVTDRLIALGAQLLIVPTMDVTSWGAREHDLHARIAPMRAAEYHVPVVRVCSSGNSQIVAADGAIVASAPYPGQGATVQGRVAIGEAGHRPVDRALAVASVVVTAGFAVALGIGGVVRKGMQIRGRDRSAAVPRVPSGV